MTEEILTVPQICEEYGLDRKRVIRYMQDARCRTLPRVAGEKYLITRTNWELFIKGETK